MDDWFAGPHWVDLVIAFSVFEGLALAMHFGLTGRGVAPAQFLANLLSGLCLMLALRNALAGAAWPWLFCACWPRAWPTLPTCGDAGAGEPTRR